MKLIVLALLALLSFASAFSIPKAPENGDLWVVIVAGSKGYYNYRHQSDVYNCYDLLVNKRGVDASKVIVMQTDDIANSRSNPHPGQVFNYPNGPDVYGPNKANLQDYTGSDVTAANFLKVLSGQDMTGVGSGRTIKSGPNDRIFFAFFDHGAPGLIAMPSGPYLYAKDLIATIKSMKVNNKYSEMLCYIEACESGSMFNNLLSDDLNVLGVTASNPFVSSWACDYSNRAKAYLNDCWSNWWMKSTDDHRSNTTYTIQQQNMEVHAVSTKSPQCVYGKKSIQQELLSNFQGIANSVDNRIPRPASTATPVDSRNVYEQHLLRSVGQQNTKVDQLKVKRELNQYYKGAQKADVIYNAFARQLNVKEYVPAANDDHCYGRSINHDCLKTATNLHNKHCGQYTEYSFKYSGLIADACNNNSAEVIGATFEKICGAF